MSNYFLKRRRPILLYVLTGVAGLVLLVAIGLVIETALGPKPPDNLQPPPFTPIDSTPATSGNPGPLQLVQGTGQTDGISIGFPHTEVGAVSAAAEDWTLIASTLSPSRARTIGTVVADPSWTGAAAALAAGPVKTRQALGLPASGPAPAGASVTLTPVEYQLRRASADQVTVLLLAYYAISLPQQQPQTRIGVYPITMHWSGGDWKVMTPDTSTDYSSLQAQPGSSQAATAGWQPLKR